MSMAMSLCVRVTYHEYNEPILGGHKCNEEMFEKMKSTGIL